jgi:hypothetical protein
MATINVHTSKTGITTYRVRIQRKGQRTQTATFPTLKEAKKGATMIEGEIIAGRHFPLKRPHTLAELLDRYTANIMHRKTLETQQSQMPVIRYWHKRLVLHHSEFDGRSLHRVQSGQPMHRRMTSDAPEKVPCDAQR